MAHSTDSTGHRTFEQADEVREFPHGRAEILKIGEGVSCTAPHFQYLFGQLAIRMDDGTEFVAGPGDVASVPGGHDAWMMGDQPVVVVDWFGASTYAQPPT
jgi:hypothetical protein